MIRRSQFSTFIYEVADFVIWNLIVVPLYAVGIVLAVVVIVISISIETLISIPYWIAGFGFQLFTGTEKPDFPEAIPVESSDGSNET